MCNSQQRFAQAWQKGKIDWTIALDPSLLALDTMIAGADAALARLEAEGWRVIFLSSRPENLRRATKDWLKNHDLLHSSDGERELILKPQKSRHISTPKWKAETVCAAASNAEQILFIDDDNENLMTVKGLWRIRGLNRDILKTFKSLEVGQ